MKNEVQYNSRMKVPFKFHSLLKNFLPILQKDIQIRHQLRRHDRPDCFNSINIMTKVLSIKLVSIFLNFSLKENAID